MKHLVSTKSHITANNVGKYVTAPMAHMQAFSGRIGEHVQTIVLGPRIAFVGVVQMLGLPNIAPFLFKACRIVLHQKHSLKRLKNKLKKNGPNAFAL
jgi:hypothetical protein